MQRPSPHPSPPITVAREVVVAEVGIDAASILENLRGTVFSEFGHVSRTLIADSLAHHVDCFILLATIDGTPVGFSAGYRRKAGVYYINFVAVLREYRRSGIGRRFMERHSDFARSRGYRFVEFNTFNHFPGMLRLGLSLNYRPIAIEQREGTDQDLAIGFGRSLTGEPTLEDRKEIDRLRAVLDRGEQVVGAVRDESTAMLNMLFRPTRFTSG